MKREITGRGRVKSPPVQRVLENRMAKTMGYMIEQIGQRVENQSIKKLNKSTVKKFEDKQSGNYANVFLGLSKEVRAKIKAQFSDDRIEAFIDEILMEADKANAGSIYSTIEQKIGISKKELMATEGLTFQLNALRTESKLWLVEQRDDAINYFVNTALRNMATGESLESIIEKHHANTKNRKDHAKFVARQQMSTYNSLATKLRADNLGIKQAKWVTARDNRVRQSHIDRNGETFDLSSGLFSWTDGKHLLPGIDFGCRCGYDLIIPE
jgi:SPP1 gp7 family putative phage head morphogenesis protein